MDAPKEFIDLVYSVENQQNYIGMGNPNARILIIGREPAHDLNTEEGKSGYHHDQELNRTNWRNLLEDKPIEGRCNPLHPFPNQRCLRDRSRDKKRPVNNNGTAITWVWYQKLVDLILGREYDRPYSLRPVDFHDFCFHTDISAAAAKSLATTNSADKTASVEERSQELFSHPFFKQFPIVILAVGTDIGKYVSHDWCDRVLGFPRTEVEETLSADNKWININRDSKGGRILVHTQSLSQPSKEYIRKIRDIIWQNVKTDCRWPKNIPMYSEIEKFISAPDTINVFFGSSYAGTAKGMFRVKPNIMVFSYPFHMSCLPRIRTREELERCSKISFFDINEYIIDNLLSDYTDYKNIIVWHDKTAHSILSIAFLAKSISKPLFHIDITDTFGLYTRYGWPMTIGNLSANDLLKCARKLGLFSETQINTYISLYNNFSCCANQLKAIVDNKIVEIDRNVIINKILDISTNIPIPVWNVIGELMGKYFNEFDFGDAVYEYIILEMIRDGELKVSDVEFDEMPRTIPRNYINIEPVIVDGKDLRKARRFKIARS